VLDDGNGGHLLHSSGYPAQFKAVGEEHLKAWKTLDGSGLDYTFVCCPDITDHEATFKYIISADIPPTPNIYRIAKGDLASFMIRESKKGEYQRKRVGISNS
jgi:putative NADH-flavin reductase